MKYYVFLDNPTTHGVCMAITYGKGKDQPGKVTDLARGQLNREFFFFPVPVRA